jgi:hypothetical protein
MNARKLAGEFDPETVAAVAQRERRSAISPFRPRTHRDRLGRRVPLSIVDA